MASWPAFGPMTATLADARRVERQQAVVDQQDGPLRRHPAGHRPSARVVLLPFVGGAVVADPSIPTRPMSRSTWRTWPSTTASSTTPSRTAAARVGPSQAEGPGISRSRPACAAGAVECVPNQSDMTTPSNPHSPRRMPPISSGCSPQYMPFTLL